MATAAFEKRCGKFADVSMKGIVLVTFVTSPRLVHCKAGVQDWCWQKISQTRPGSALDCELKLAVRVVVGFTSVGARVDASRTLSSPNNRRRHSRRDVER